MFKLVGMQPMLAMPYMYITPHCAVRQNSRKELNCSVNKQILRPPTEKNNPNAIGVQSSVHFQFVQNRRITGCKSSKHKN